MPPANYHLLSAAALFTLLAAAPAASQNWVPVEASTATEDAGKARSDVAWSIIATILNVSIFIILFTFFWYCFNGNSADDNGAVIGDNGGTIMKKGLDPELIEALPTMSYEEAQKLMADRYGGGGKLECAICLCEFDGDEKLRLLPRCRHVFHQDCIGAWLENHVTCPVCRADLAAAVQELKEEHVAIDVVDESEEMMEMVELCNRKRASRSRSRTLGRASLDRLTRLPERVVEEIVARRWSTSSTITDCVGGAITGGRLTPSAAAPLRPPPSG